MRLRFAAPYHRRARPPPLLPPACSSRLSADGGRTVSSDLPFASALRLVALFAHAGEHVEQRYPGRKASSTIRSTIIPASFPGGAAPSRFWKQYYEAPAPSLHADAYLRSAAP